MNKILNTKYLNINVLDCYIIYQLITPFYFGIVIFTVVGELIGITFEQIRFMVNNDLPLSISLNVHFLKLPAFISTALPFACLLSTTITYTKLSRQQELIALQSFGINLYRLTLPALILCLIVGLMMFVFHETIVPEANYRAALILEHTWEIDRNNLAKYNKQALMYPEFSKDNEKQQLKSIFIADYFNNREVTGVTILQFKNAQIHNIYIARSAGWNETKNMWDLFDVSHNVIDKNGSYTQQQEFAQISLDLPKNILYYANNNRDLREMNIFQLYRRLKITNLVDKEKNVRKLKVNIQERYAFPCSCLFFGFLGSAMGVISKPQSKSNASGMIVIVIFIYYILQFFATILAITGYFQIFLGVWLPNLFGIGFSCFLLRDSM